MSYAKNLMLQIPMATGGFEFYFKMQLGNLVRYTAQRFEGPRFVSQRIWSNCIMSR